MRVYPQNLLSNLLKTLAFAVFIALLTGAVQKQERMSKKEAISFLKSFAKSNRGKLRDIDQRIRASLMKTYNSELAPNDKDIAKSLSNREIEVLTLKRKEHQLRENFLDRLIFTIDRKYKRGPWQGFLAQQIIEMASIEATSMGSDVGFVKFCGYMSAALKRIPERSENLFAFMEGYIEFSTIMNPRPPSEYLKHRSYTNGRTAEFSKGVPKEEVGDIVEDRLARLAYLKSLERKPFEERAPILKPIDLTLEQPTEITGSLETMSARTATLPYTGALSPKGAINPKAQPAPLPDEPKQQEATQVTEAKLETQTGKSNVDLESEGMQLRIKLKDIHSNGGGKKTPSENEEKIEADSSAYENAL
ncbi:MAG: hypothetical protein AAF202_04210 [Pseudomonadota bacterium]